MSEKDKSQSKEMAELLAENPEAATYTLLYDRWHESGGGRCDA